MAALNSKSKAAPRAGRAGGVACARARATTRGSCRFAYRSAACANAGSNSGARGARSLVRRAGFGPRFNGRACRGSAQASVCSGTGSADGRCRAATHTRACPAGAAGVRAARQSAPRRLPGRSRSRRHRHAPVEQDIDGGVSLPRASSNSQGRGSRRGRLQQDFPAERPSYNLSAARRSVSSKAVIVDPQRIRLPSETCELDSAMRDGGSLKLIAECANVNTYTSRTVYVKLRSNGELVYSPTGDPVLATNLMRCPI